MAGAHSDIVYMSDDRYIDHSMASGPYTPTSPYKTQTLPYPNYDDGWWAWEAGAFQNSSLSSNSMSGTGSTYAGFDAMNYGAFGTSVFSVTFGVDTTSSATLSGSLDSNWFDSHLSVSLLEDGVVIFGLDNYSMSRPYELFSLVTLLEVGKVYQLELFSSAFDSDYYDETWNFNLNVSAVPLPAAAWLFGSGLLGLVTIAKRKTRSTIRHALSQSG